MYLGNFKYKRQKDLFREVVVAKVILSTIIVNTGLKLFNATYELISILKEVMSGLSLFISSCADAAIGLAAVGFLRLSGRGQWRSWPGVKPVQDEGCLCCANRKMCTN